MDIIECKIQIIAQLSATRCWSSHRLVLLTHWQTFAAVKPSTVNQVLVLWILSTLFSHHLPWAPASHSFVLPPKSLHKAHLTPVTYAIAVVYITVSSKTFSHNVRSSTSNLFQQNGSELLNMQSNPAESLWFCTENYRVSWQHDIMFAQTSHSLPTIPPPLPKAAGLTLDLLG